VDSEQDRTAPQTPETGANGTGRRVRKPLIDRISDKLNRLAYGEGAAETDADPESEYEHECEINSPSAFQRPDVPAAAPVYPAGAAFRVATDANGDKIVTLVDAGELTPSATKREADAVSLAVMERDNLLEALENRKVGLAGSEIMHVLPTRFGVTCSVRLPKGCTIADVIDKLKEIESAWDAFENTVTVSRIPGEKSRVVLISRNDTDPLSGETYTEPTKNATIHRPAPVGFDEAGNPVLINLLRTHIGIVGGNGSGKSSMLNNILMYLTACNDAVILLIDLQKSGSLRLWTKAAARPVARTPEQAKQLLEGALHVARYRADKLGIDAESFIESDDEDDYSPDWEPTPEEPALVVVIDEASLLAEASLIYLVLELLRLGRKCAVTVILANQRADKDTMGSASVRKEFTVRIAMRMDADDVDMFLGENMRKAGWLADRLLMPGLFYLLATTNLTAEIQPPRRCRTTQPAPSTCRLVIRENENRRPSLDAKSAASSPIALRVEEFHEAVIAIGNLTKTKTISTEALAKKLAARDVLMWGGLTTADVVAEMRTYGEAPDSRDTDEGKKNAYYTYQLLRLQPADA
jgi:hypothetical protein